MTHYTQLSNVEMVREETIKQKEVKMCKHLREFLNFQLSLLKQEAKMAHKDVEAIAIGWVRANSRGIRNVFCTQICPHREDCEERIQKDDTDTF